MKSASFFRLLRVAQQLDVPLGEEFGVLLRLYRKPFDKRRLGDPVVPEVRHRHELSFFDPAQHRALSENEPKETLVCAVTSVIALVLSITGALKNVLPFDAAWVAILLCGVPILVGAFILATPTAVLAGIGNDIAIESADAMAAAAVMKLTNDMPLVLAITILCAVLGILISIVGGTPVGSTIVAVDIMAFAVFPLRVNYWEVLPDEEGRFISAVS